MSSTPASSSSGLKLTIRRSGGKQEEATTAAAAAVSGSHFTVNDANRERGEEEEEEKVSVKLERMEDVSHTDISHSSMIGVKHEVKREVNDTTTSTSAVPSHAPPPPRNPAATGRPTFTLSALKSTASSATTTTLAETMSSAPSSTLIDSAYVRNRTRRRPKSILDYLTSLKKSALDALYQDTFTCLTIFRSLHPLSKQYLLRWLFIDRGVPLSLVNQWVMDTPISMQAHAAAMKALWDLKLITKDAPPGIVPSLSSSSSSASSSRTLANQVIDSCVYFNPVFQKSLQNALSNNIDSSNLLGTVADGDLSTMHDPSPPSIERLDEYAKVKWDSILHWMVGASTAVASISAASASHTAGLPHVAPAADLQIGIPAVEVTSRLIAMGLVDSSSGTKASSVKITPSGFAFLFKEQNVQVWDLILAYMEELESGPEASRDEVLQFLFRLSFLQLGKGYNVSTLTNIQKKVLRDLKAFGLIYMDNLHAHMFYPTRLALNLSSTTAAASSNASAAAAAAGSGAAASSSSSGTTSFLKPANAGEGYIILETTFRLYAFTTSPFHIALLGLFCRLDIRLPNLVIGTITKESVRAALKNNITSAEIISYLDNYAKSDMRVNTPVLPETVTDQIRLWESERARFTLQESYLFEFDNNDPEFVRNLIIQEAYKIREQILLHHRAEQILVMTFEGYQRIKAFKLDLNQKMKQEGLIQSDEGDQPMKSV